MEVWEKEFEEETVEGVWNEGIEYGFDKSVDVEGEEGKWLKEGLEKVRGVWLE